MARSGAATFCSFLELAERISTAAVRNSSTPQEAQDMETDYITLESTNISTNRNVIGRWGDLGNVDSMPILAVAIAKLLASTSMTTYLTLRAAVIELRKLTPC